MRENVEVDKTVVVLVLGLNTLAEVGRRCEWNLVLRSHNSDRCTIANESENQNGRKEAENYNSGCCENMLTTYTGKAAEIEVATF